ncbi:MAG: type II secretion system protein [Chitinophagales bacterium]
MKKRQRGFTLIELLVVIAIIGVLAALAIPRFGTVEKDAKKDLSMSYVKRIIAACELYKAKNGVELAKTDVVGDTTSGISKLNGYGIAGDIKSPLDKTMGYTVAVDATSGDLTVTDTADTTIKDVVPGFGNE